MMCVIHKDFAFVTGGVDDNLPRLQLRQIHSDANVIDKQPKSHRQMQTRTFAYKQTEQQAMALCTPLTNPKQLFLLEAFTSPTVLDKKCLYFYLQGTKVKELCPHQWL